MMGKRSAPISTIAMGEVIVAPDATPTDVTQGIEGLARCFS